MRHKIMLVGFGTVGQGLTEILSEKRSLLKTKYGFEYDIVAVCDFAYGNVYNPDKLDTGQMLTEAKAKQKFSKDLSDKDTISLIKDCNATVVCELTYTDLKTGGLAMDHCRAALGSKKHLVTSNKGPAALGYPEMKSLADQNGVRFLIEGTVCAGTPVLNLTDGPLAGCEISAIRGILNGTTNYMLSEMEKGMAYDDVLKIAQEKGYAEADPAGDVEGYDAQGKVVILANVVMGASLTLSDIAREGITKISSQDIESARNKNSRWKLIGTVSKQGDSITGSVAPEMVDLSHPLAGVMGATNALTFTTDLLGDVTIVGPGAGRTETGFSILTDLIKIHRS